MEIFDPFNKKGGEAGGVVTQTIEFQVGPNLREVDEGGVEAIDRALLRVGSGEVMHLIDSRRINAFSSGGPSTWSVAFVPVGNDQLFVTYGNSDRIDPARTGFGFELSIRVPAAASGLWPGLLLRQLVRYMLQSRRELKTEDFMPFPSPITRVTGSGDPSQFPPIEMDAVFLVADPLLPVIETPRGPIEVRRVVSMFPDERALMEPWSVKGLVEVMQQSLPDLSTDIGRLSFARDAAFVDAMTEGSRRDGSQFGFVAVPGVSWAATDAQCTIKLPGGAEALRIHRMVQARLRRGQKLLIHDTDPAKPQAVALEPAQEWDLSIKGDVLVLQVPLDAPHLKLLADPPDGPITWKLS